MQQKVLKQYPNAKVEKTWYGYYTIVDEHFILGKGWNEKAAWSDAARNAGL